VMGWAGGLAEQEVARALSRRKLCCKFTRFGRERG
jgi:hypothetical protein